MLRASAAADYVVATGEPRAVRDLCEIAFRRVGLDYGRYVVENPNEKRRTDATPLVGDSSFARRTLSWSPSVTFVELIEMMVDADVLETASDTSAAQR